MNFSRIANIISPISGLPVKPIIKDRISGNTIIKEAHYFDPSSGEFIRKVILSEDLIDTKKSS